MKTETVGVVETFVSLQGESTRAGLPCFFVRLGGCNLRCRYCDTRGAYGSGRKTPVSALARRFAASKAALAEITGGEPLLQPGFRSLALALRQAGRGRPVLVETNGSLDISMIPDGVIAVMDIKCPGSGEEKATDWANLKRLRPYDEVKFVVSDRRDFDWARRIVTRHKIDQCCQAVAFSPVAGKLPAARLAGWILKSGLPVRLQLQLHKVLGMK